MICPIMTSGNQLVPCPEENCAWWDNKYKKCLVLIIARAITQTSHLAAKKGIKTRNAGEENAR